MNAVKLLQKESQLELQLFSRRIYPRPHRLALEDPDYFAPLNLRGSLGTMFSTSRNEKMAEVLTGTERRRRRTPQEKDHHGAADL